MKFQVVGGENRKGHEGIRKQEKGLFWVLGVCLVVVILLRGRPGAGSIPNARPGYRKERKNQNWRKRSPHIVQGKRRRVPAFDAAGSGKKNEAGEKCFAIGRKLRRGGKRRWKRDRLQCSFWDGIRHRSRGRRKKNQSLSL